MENRSDKEDSVNKEQRQADEGANDYSLSSSNSVSNTSQKQIPKQQSSTRQKKRLSLSKDGVSGKENERSLSKSQGSVRSRSRSRRRSAPRASRSASKDKTLQSSKREQRYGSSEERQQRKQQDDRDKGDRSHRKSYKKPSGNDMEQYDGADQYQEREAKYSSRHRDHAGINKYESRGRKTRFEYPSFHKHLFTKKEFENYQSSNLGFDSKGELNEAYDDYVQAYKKEQDREFYQEHKADPWFIERYDPVEILKWKQAQYALGQFSAAQYKEVVIQSLANQSDEYLKIQLDQDPQYDYNNMQNEQGVEISLHKAPLFAFDTDSLTLYLKYIPVHIQRIDLKEALVENLEGFVHLSMSEPMRNHFFDRLAWVNFSSEHHCEQALEKIQTLSIEDFQLSAARSHPNKKRTPVRITPPLPSDQVLYDYELCKKLISQVFDPERSIETYVIEAIEGLQIEKPSNEQQQINSNGAKVGLTNEEKLDLSLLYLRRVHAFCLYCGEEYEDERMLSTRCGPQHIRNHQKISEQEFSLIIQQNQQLPDPTESGLAALRSSNIDDAQSDGKNPEDDKNQTDSQPGQMEENKKEETNEKEREANQLWTTIQSIAQLDSKSSAKWGGSIIFLKRYVSQALDRIKYGPRKLKDPYQEFLDQDQEKFCKYHTIEIEKGEKYKCDICAKKFEGEKFVMKHIRNKHIDETYAKRKIKEWVKNTFRDNMRKEMKQNYYNDKNKLFNQPGRKYHPSETQYYVQGRRGSGDWGDAANQHQGQHQQRGNFGGYRGGGYNRDRRPRGGGGYNRGERQGNQREYVDYDDPENNQTRTGAKPQGGDRDVVDYSDLFD